MSSFRIIDDGTGRLVAEVVTLGEKYLIDRASVAARTETARQYNSSAHDDEQMLDKLDLCLFLQAEGVPFDAPWRTPTDAAYVAALRKWMTPERVGRLMQWMQAVPLAPVISTLPTQTREEVLAQARERNLEYGQRLRFVQQKGQK